MGIEIERKFLVNSEKWEQAAKTPGMYFRQGYLLNQPDKIVRVRVTDNQGFITIKGSTTGISRKEFEYEVPRADAIELLDSFAEATIEKTRYNIIVEGKKWEVDVFMGDNSGLLLAEIELKQEDEPFALPEWVTLEVSLDKRYFNSNLAVSPYKNWGQ